MFKNFTPLPADYHKCKTIISNQELNPPLPKELLSYVIAIEDRRFFAHRGFDMLSIARVLFYRFFGLKTGGASTIGQQLARTITDDRQKCLARKIREIKVSCKIDRNFSKDTIIESYLNIAYFGLGLVGVQAFSKNFFKKTVSDLDNTELAIVASCLRYPYPEELNDEWLFKVNKRARYAMRKANEANWIKKHSRLL